jgi:hypothetical protein
MKRILTSGSTDSVERNTSWQAGSTLAGHEIARILWNPKVHNSRLSSPEADESNTRLPVLFMYD